MKKLIIAPNNMHHDILLKYRQDNPFNDVKILSKESLIGEWKGRAEKSAINYLMKKHDYSYDHARMILPFLPFINEKMGELYLIKNELIDKMYQIKIIDCGDYVQVYEFEHYHFHKDKSFLDIKFTDTENLYKKKNTNKLKSILLSNALRSNFNIQRLARKNINSWNCFITLTFKENIKDITLANKKFNQFISNVRKLKKDFKYLAVPEFQKRGAVHYHLLSNLDLCSGVIIPQKNKKGRANNIDSLYDIKYWNQGFCRVDFIKSNHTKIFSYLTKYMTKDIDNRLWSKKRYFFSQNLAYSIFL